MTRDDVDKFEKLKVQLDSLYGEMSVLAKKTPNGPVNAFKIKLVNATLVLCNDLFGEKYQPFSDFQLFSADDLPSNSDVTFIVSQYIECAEKLRADNITLLHGFWYWRIPKEELSIRTSGPQRLVERK